MSGDHLPEGWTVAKISDITIKGEQRKPSSKETFTYVDIGSIDRDRKCISSPQYLAGKNAPSRARKVIKTGDVLVSLTRPNLNAVAFVPDELDNQIASTGFEVVKPLLVDSRFVFALTKSKDFIDSISGVVQGALYPAAKSSDVQAYTFQLPALAEQKVIAEKLDQLLAQVEATKARLERIPEILKSFRQSVLTAAVSGKLTEEWRLEHQVPDSINFTEETKKERLQKGIREGKLAKDANVPYVPYEIPESWNWVRLGHLALKITDGAHNTPKVLESGFPYLMAKDLTGGQLDFSENRFVSEDVHRELYNKCQPEVGDLLVVNIGAGTGNNVLIDVDFEFSFKNIAIVKRPNYIAPGYMQYYFESAKQRIFQDQAKGGAQPFLSLTMLNDVPFALPPQCEQTEIVRRVEELFAFADRIEQKANVALERVNNLTQSILAKAFRGELTTDWRAANPELISGENSAEALLERIKAEREALKSKPKPKRTAVKKKSGSRMSKKITKVTDALKQAGKPLTGQQLLAEAGYPSDSSTEQLEQFFLDIRYALTIEKSIVKLDRDDDGQGWFALAEPVETKKA
jgi:type I restriction enzyme S subunit